MPAWVQREVAQGETTFATVLARGGADNSLGGGHGWDGGQDKLLDDGLVVHGLDQGARPCMIQKAGDGVLQTIAGVMADTHDDGLWEWSLALTE